MNLRDARLCLNCEEIHVATHCPVCASESFAYLSRWIPAEERRRERRSAAASQPAQAGQAGQPGGASMRWVKRGAAGVAVLAASRMLWNLSRPVEWSEGELPPEAEDQEPGPGRR